MASISTASDGVAFTRLWPWIERRASEKSTYIGLAIVAANLGFPSVAAHLTGVGDVAPAILATLGAGLMTASTTPRPALPPAPTPFTLPELLLLHALPPVQVPNKSTTKKGTFMSVISVARKLFGVIAVAVAPTWNKAIADSLAQAEATLVPLLGDDAKKLCEDAASTTDGGFVKLEHVVADLATLAANKGIKADYMVLTVIAAKAYAQVKVDAPALLDVAIETGISAASLLSATLVAA